MAGMGFSEITVNLDNLDIKFVLYRGTVYQVFKCC